MRPIIKADGPTIWGGCVPEYSGWDFSRKVVPSKTPDDPALRDIRAGLTEAESADRPKGASVRSERHGVQG